TMGRTGKIGQRGENDEEITKRNVIKRECELASQRKNRQQVNFTAVRSEPTHGAWHLASFDVEEYRNDKSQFGSRKLIRRPRHRLGARQHGERFLVESGRS